MTRLIDRADLFNRLATVQTLAEAFAVIQGMPEAEPTFHPTRWTTQRQLTTNLQLTCNQKEKKK